jgi:hypothetical protein
VESVGWDQAAPFCKGPPEGWRFIDGLELAH